MQSDQIPAFKLSYPLPPLPILLLAATAFIGAIYFIRRFSIERRRH